MITELRKIALTLLCLLTVTFVIGQTTSLKKANKLHELHEYADAIKAYTKLLKDEPNNIEAMSKLADSYYHVNQMDKAELWFSKASGKVGFRPNYLLTYAKTLMGLKAYDKATNKFSLYAEGDEEVGLHYVNSCKLAVSRSGESPTYKVSPSKINTDGSDFGIAIYGDKVVYASSRDDMKQSGGTVKVPYGKNQLFLIDQNSKGDLSNPKFLKSKIKSSVGEGPLSFSADGKMVAYTKNTFVKGVRQIPSSGAELSIYLAQIKENGEWVNEIAFPYNGSGYSTGFPSLSADGKTLYFASDRPDGFGGFDIFVSKKNGNLWSPPENLGGTVNSTGDEITPFMDGNELYFASDYHNGFGGFDIFRTKKSNNKWNKIYHLGTGINSERDDYGFVYDAKNDVSYFVSNRLGGKGNEDIYQAKTTKAMQRFAVIVKDADSKQLLENATLDFTACGEKLAKTDKNGRYAFKAPTGFKCNGIAKLEGYTNAAFNLSNPTKIDGDVKMIELLITKNASTASTGTTPPSPTSGTPTTSGVKNQYVGKIMDSGTSKGLSGVKIWANNQISGEQVETFSDRNGVYVVDLESRSAYDINFSKAGYNEKSKTVNTGDGKDKSILDVLFMKKAPKDVVITTTPVSTTPTTTTPTTSTEEPPVVVTTEPSTPKVEEPSTPKVDPPTTTTTTEDNSQKTKGYAVQIAAFGKDQNINMSNYKDLKKIGNLYVRKIDKYKKVRIGVFRSKAEASAASKSIKTMGYSSAFIVKEDGANASIASISDIPTPSTVVTSVPVLTSKGSSSARGTYMIQLGAYKNTKWFDGSKVRQYGTVIERRKGDLTLKLLTGFSDINSANRARAAAISKGFTGAFIVQDQGGVLTKVR